MLRRGAQANLRLLAVAAAALSMFAWTACAPAFGQAPASSPPPFESAIASAKSKMMADPVEAHRIAVEAEALASDEDGREAATAMWLQAEALNRMNRSPEARPLIEKALAAPSVARADSKLFGDLLVARAVAARAEGDYETALASFQSAHDVFHRLGEARARSMALQSIATIYTDARDYQRALHYFEQAGEAFAGDPPIELTRLNNIANARRELGQFAEAEAGYRRALEIAEAMKSLTLQSRILANIATVQLAAGRPDAAERTAQQGLALSTSGERMGWEPFLWGVEAQAAFAKGEEARAARLIEQTFAGQDIARTSVSFREFHAAAHRIYSATGQTRLALAHLEAFKRLDDEARDISAAANTALMSARFDFATQELQIANLRAKTLENEISLRRAQDRQRQIFLVAAALVALVLIVGGTIHYASIRRSRDAVRSANDRLSRTNEDLERALKAKSEFLATTSHEIRTPLNGVLGMTEVLLHQPGLPEDALERIKLVHGAGHAMKAIVDDILDVAKMETGQVSLADAEFNLAETLTGVAQVWRDAAEAKGVSLDVDLDQCPQTVVGDAQRVRQIVFNLVSNAVKFTDSGQVALRARPTAEPAGIEIEVSDTGCGVPEAQLSAIFEPFHQVDGGVTRQHAGTGLGLSICRSLARAMGGDVTVESRLGAGSAFTVRLPLAQTEQGQATPTSQATLVIDPNPMRQAALAAMLNPAGDDFEAGALAQGLERIKARGAAAIVIHEDALESQAADAMDQIMQLRAAAPEARIVVALNAGARIPAPMLRLAGADEVVEGGFDLTQLAAALECERKPTASPPLAAAG
jgi:signal transduction histidine kinase/tetratricopeptide (TPR) repeat protein